MHHQKRFQSLGNGCQRSFLFPSTLNALCVCVCILTTVLYYYALSTTANRKSSHKWRRREREEKVCTIQPDHIKNCCSRTPGAACLAEAGLFPTTPIDGFASLYNLPPSSPWPREWFLSSLWRAQRRRPPEAHSKAVFQCLLEKSLDFYDQWKDSFKRNL